jgi:hypothetical protein
MTKCRIHIMGFLGLLLHLSVAAQTPFLNSYSSAAPTVYLDFDGGVVDGTVWNENGVINAAPSGLSAASVIWIHKMISEHFTLFNLNITTDPAVYDKAPPQQRIRIIFTADGSWYGPVTGISAIGSFVWGDDTPAWVFMDALSNNPSFIASCAAHQIGHALGLQHQSEYDANGILITELSGGENNIFSTEAPLMGIPFYKQASWKTGHSCVGSNEIQNDTAIIAGQPNNIGYRKNNEYQIVENGGIHIEKTIPGLLELNSSGSYDFRIYDINGRLLSQGILKTGYNEIHDLPSSTGIYVLQWSNNRFSGSQKIML